MPWFVAAMRLIRGLSMQFVDISVDVTFASHMFRLDVAAARFCFNLGRCREISVLAQGNSGTRPIAAR
jgi:DNA end-binding protein Ku